ncbi:zinc finger MYM-type protein 1-like [Helianthus annuus]|uniref:zinc finger MYM-type protein 1-like n=1 Tax=Helianthus annuus TaxID=4232 RepID=UPI000B8F1DB8|nr:zinc finger MYM-type protein 1-like [Helianthus annuus]
MSTEREKIDFPQTFIGNGDKLRRFNPKWYTEKHGNWLEYSVKTDRVYCLYCYLFKESGQKYAFASEGVQCWHRKEERFESHVGKCNSFHNRVVQKGEDLLKEAQSIPAVQKKPEQNKEYRIRLSTSAILAKGLLNGGLPFRGHDESEASLYRGHFIEFLKLFEQINEEIGKYILSNALKNCQMTASSIQKDICNCFAEEVLKMIFEERGDDERYIGVVHVTETTALSLKSAIDELFAHRNLSLGRVRGQGYDDASNMSGEFNGLKTLILKENSSAYYVHCFAHQLQLVVVALANKHLEICRFFKEITDLINVVGASCKQIDLLRESQRELLALNPEVVIESGNNQEMALTRPGDTRWSSHEKTLLRLLTLYPCVIEVLEYIETSA